MLTIIRTLSYPNLKLAALDFGKYLSSTVRKPVENSMRSKLARILEPIHLEVINESYMHNVPKGSETHFKVVVVSDEFIEVPLIKRHRVINEILKEELENGVHALSIEAKTHSQWKASDNNIESSPKCKGGFGK